jgi:hypothetical protein
MSALARADRRGGYPVHVRPGLVSCDSVWDSFVPLMRELAGFRGYYLLDGGPDELIAISLFDSADEALVSNEKAADWVRNNVMEFARGLPEVMVGDVLVAELK